MRGKFPKVAVEYTGPDRTHQERPSRDASVRAAAMYTFFYGTECSIGLQSLEPNESVRQLTEEKVCTSNYRQQVLHTHSVDTPRGA